MNPLELRPDIHLNIADPFDLPFLFAAMAIMMIGAFVILAHFMTAVTHGFMTAIHTFHILASAGFALGLLFSFAFGIVFHNRSYVHVMKECFPIFVSKFNQ